MNSRIIGFNKNNEERSLNPSALDLGNKIIKKTEIKYEINVAQADPFNPYKGISIKFKAIFNIIPMTVLANDIFVKFSFIKY